MLSRLPAALARSTSSTAAAWRPERGEYISDLALGDLIEQAVTADNVAINDDRNELPRIDQYLFVDTEGASDDVALWMNRSPARGSRPSRTSASTRL